MNLADVVAGARGSPGEGLRALDALARAISRTRWFSAAGRPLSPASLAAANAVLEGVMAAGAEIRQADSWSRSRRLYDRHHEDGAIAAEFVMECRNLRQWAEARNSADLLQALLADVRSLAYDTAHGAAAGATLLAGVRDRDVARLAASEAGDTALGAGLAIAAGATDHPFVHLLALLEAGHWPIGTVDGVFWIF
ncbi:MAG TPA: hypothetical protein VKS60_24725 [Stellaceae bacterium]|nr:hypothetical protein [Stellaceae bacterium]